MGGGERGREVMRREQRVPKEAKGRESQGGSAANRNAEPREHAEFSHLETRPAKVT